MRVVGGANGRGSLGKGLMKIYEHISIVDVNHFGLRLCTVCSRLGQGIMVTSQPRQ
jgi:hypothetical protein